MSGFFQVTPVPMMGTIQRRPPLTRSKKQSKVVPVCQNRAVTASQSQPDGYLENQREEEKGRKSCAVTMTVAVSRTAA
jgi:hypothetical protein